NKEIKEKHEMIEKLNIEKFKTVNQKLNDQYTDLLTKNAMDEEIIKKLKKEIKKTIDEKDKVENDLF
ncbi:35235_t:CDS:2, partial [Gigaspora margarita]